MAQRFPLINFLSTIFNWSRHPFGRPWKRERRRLKSASPGSEEVFEAAARLMGRNLKYDAIRLFYEMKMYREAGDILRATGSMTEAARLYVIGKHWEQAELCFSTVLDWKNAARCARAARKFDRAAGLFVKAEHPAAAARCYRKLRSWRLAAINFEKAGLVTDAVSCWSEWTRTSDVDAVVLSDAELGSIASMLGKTGIEPRLVRVLENHSKLALLVYQLLANDRAQVASEIYESRADRLRTDLCDLVSADTRTMQAALEMFLATGDGRGAAVLYDLTDRPYDATECYEKVGDLAAAYACALKAEWWEKIATLKVRMNTPEKITAVPVFDKPVPNQAHSVVSLMSAPREIPLTEFSTFEMTGSSMEMSPAFVESRFFNQLSEQDRKSLWEIGQIGTFGTGETIVDYESYPQGTFTLLKGRLKIFRRNAGRETVVDCIEAGENFGESWLILGLRSEVRIVAEGQCHLHLLARQGFEHSMARGSSINARIVNQLAQAVCSHLLKRFGVTYALPESAI